MQLPRALAPALSLVLLASTAGAEILERVVAKVNGDIITLSEFEARQVAALQTARIGAEGVEEYLRQNNARILQDAVDELLLVQRGEEMGFRLRPEYVDEVVEGIKKDNQIESDQALAEQLRREGMTLADLKRNLSRSIVRRQVVAREVEARSTVTEADARADYEANAAAHEVPAAVVLQEMLLGDQAEAREVVARVRAGEDFAALARERSRAVTAASGGELGRVRKGDLAPDIEKVAFSLPAGAVSEPFPSGGGFRVLRVASKEAARKTPFDEAKGEILRRLNQEKAAREYEKYIEGLRKQANIQLRVREVPLQVSLPAAGALVGASGGSTPRAAAEGEDDEFSVTPQAEPERVAPPAAAPPKKEGGGRP